MAERYVLDTSAILAFTDNEEGADEVQQLLEAARTRQCVIDVCAISLMEISYITEREQGEDDAAQLVALVKAWPITWVYPDEKTLLQAAKLKAAHRLSVADALIAAVAKLAPATLVHKDPEFEALPRRSCCGLSRSSPRVRRQRRKPCISWTWEAWHPDALPYPSADRVAAHRHADHALVVASSPLCGLWQAPQGRGAQCVCHWLRPAFERPHW